MRQIHAVNILLSDIPAGKKIFPPQTCLANEPFLLYEFVWKAFQGNTTKKAVDGRAIHRLILRTTVARFIDWRLCGFDGRPDVMLELLFSWAPSAELADRPSP